MVGVDDLILEIGRLGLWIETVGIVVVLWIVIQSITLFYNWKRRKLLENIDLRVRRIESKIDKLTGKR